jgi:hypothetical protein
MIVSGTIGDDGTRLVLVGLTRETWRALRRPGGYLELSAETQGVIWPAGVTVVLFAEETDMEVLGRVVDLLGPTRVDQRRPM